MAAQILEQGAPELDYEKTSSFVNPRDPFVQLSQTINWHELEREANQFFSPLGRPRSSARVVVGLIVTRYLFNLSERTVIQRFLESTSIQAFCGFTEFQLEPPVSRQTLNNWIHKLGDFAGRILLKQSIQAALQHGLVKTGDLEVVSADTTVQPKAIKHPTDGHLFAAAIKKLDLARKQYGERFHSKFDKTYRLAAKAAMEFYRGQTKAAKARLARLKKTLKRKIESFCKIFNKIRDSLKPQAIFEIEEMLAILVSISDRSRHQKNKIYSVHCPEVQCYVKGNGRNRSFQFGSKVAIVTTQNNSLILGVVNYTSTVYDGHTLGVSIIRAEENTGVRIKTIAVDSNYSSKECIDSIAESRYRFGQDVTEELPEVIHGRKKNLTKVQKRTLRKRSRIEAIIGHAKADHKLGLNRYWGKVGDEANAMLSTAAFNLKKLYNHFSYDQRKAFNLL